MNEKDYGALSTVEEADRQIYGKILKIGESISKTDDLRRMLLNCWDSEESAVFFSAYEEFRKEILDLTDKYEKDITGLEGIKREIALAQSGSLSDNIIL